jgi:NADH dehydrogenase/NADH:ubiquinone oxidoreductase subunit G
MLKLTIDNKTVEVTEGATILAAAAQAGVAIPTLCHNQELTPAGACRICVVEMERAGSQAELVTACSYPAVEGMVVRSASPKALEARKLAVELLLALKPHSNMLAKIAESLGVGEPRFELPQQECILCQLCTRSCQEVVGVNAITFIARGRQRENADARVVWSNERCIACGSCAYICPTKAVTLEDNGGLRVLNTPSGRMEFKLKACTKCGSYYAPEKQLEYMSRASGIPLEKFGLCLDCRD